MNVNMNANIKMKMKMKMNMKTHQYLEAKDVWVDSVGTKAAAAGGAGVGAGASSQTGAGGGSSITAEGTDTVPATAPSSSSGVGVGGGSGRSGYGVDSGPSGIAYARAIELLESNRSSLFAVVSQYRTLFCSADIGTSASRNGAAGGSSSSSSSSSNDEAQGHTPLGSLQAWVTTRVSRLLGELGVLLQAIEEGASMRAALENVSVSCRA
jgi:hypothetical protein